MARHESSKNNRDAQRANAAAEVMTAGLKAINPVVAIPTKFAQMINSGFLLFRERPKVHEKIAHGVQCALAFSQICILTAMLFEEEKCETNSPNLCKSLLLTDLFYQGILILGWAPAEFFKDEVDAIETASSSESPETTDESSVPSV